ncbi:MAG TPA: Asp-tRNA(Asn)/Glu-tRNA(Gln) amidotransferase subunit GatA [Solirubrobacterales bacterium]|nr:Asp-tRNA(Asn)/Glu-tRNA(Gln) amidotransferase subunit GatA [Solirubrobacterales bacterium]
MSDPRLLTVAEGLGEIAAGNLSANEWFAAYAGAPDELGAYLWRPDGTAVRPDDTASGPLAGVPVAIKDIFCIEGLPATAGSRILEGYVPPYTATAVERLLAAGASVLGKTNMDEFAMGSSNENSAYGDVRNPWDRERVPGGSSGGSAAVVAGGLAPCSIGTDTGGSIRQPASLCGVVGLKPTYGSISRSGMIAFASSLDQCGPFTRDVRDAALLLSVLGGRDERDSTSVGFPEPVTMPARDDLNGLRVGVPRELGADAEGIETGVRDVFERTVALCEELGAEVAETHLPNARHGISAYYVLAPAEASANLARYDGVRFGLRLEADSLDEMYERTRSAGFGPEVKRRIMLGTYALSSGFYEAYYGSAQRVRTLIARDFAAAFANFDLLITPTSPTVAFELGARAADPLAMYMSDYCTVPMSLAGLPAISIPAGLAAPDGGGPELPVGLQITGPAFSESLILDAAHAIEGAVGFDYRPKLAEAIR